MIATFKMLDSIMPCYQSGLGNRLCYEFTFNNYGRAIQSTEASAMDAKHEISDISLEYEIVAPPDLARCASNGYQSMVLFYDKILRHRHIPVSKSDTVWNWSFNTSCKSIKGILLLFEEERSYA